MSSKNVLKLIKDKQVEFVDLRFTDPKGKLQHLTMDATVVDEDIDITDPVRVEWAMMTRWQPDSDSIILSNQKGSSLDPSRLENGKTAKIGIDATIPWGYDRSGFMSVQ